MDIRLVAYKKEIVSSGIRANDNIAQTNDLYAINTLELTAGDFPVGTDPTAYFVVGKKINNNQSLEIGTIKSIDSTLPIYSLQIRGAMSTILSTEYIYTTRDTAHNLDLQDNASVSLNFQFTDTKEPEKRKASHSQTFKIPFTDANNQFFENWYNVNIETLNYDTRMQIDAVLYVGATPQFEGVLQLKAVYLKTGLYEVVLLSNSASLFNSMGDKTVQEAFEPFEDWQFEYNYANIGYSWDGSTDLFTNLAGTSFRDTSRNVQKVMFPMQVSKPGFLYPEPGVSDGHLRMDQAAIDAIVVDFNDVNIPQTVAVPIHQFKPSIQLKTILQQIIYGHGFTYESTFIDSEYFSRLYMTTCNHTGQPHCTILQTPGMVDGSASCAYDGTLFWAYDLHNWQEGPLYAFDWVVLNPSTNSPSPPGASFPSDPDDLWDVGLNAFRRTDSNMTGVRVESKCEFTNVVADTANGCRFTFRVEVINPYTLQPDPNYTYGGGSVWDDTVSTTVGNQDASFDHVVSLTGVPIGWYARIYVRIVDITRVNAFSFSMVQYGPPGYLAQGTRLNMTVQWTGFYDNVYGKIVDTAAGIDPSLKQKDFLKDMIQRFNLVVIPDKEDPTKLVIEPFNDYMGSGEIRNWTDKLDLSKDIKIKDTLSLQSETREYTDAEDEDLKNKSVKDFLPSMNVYGHWKAKNLNNQYATGDFKYQSPFSPYINEQVFSTWTGGESFIERMVVQYETSYEAVDGGIYVDISSPVTKPKLFYYSGKKTNAFSNPSQQYFLHRYTTDTATYPSGLIAYGFTDYPLCTPFELEVEDGGFGEPNVNTRSLYWNRMAPDLAGTPMFDYEPYAQFQMFNSLYYTYWQKFANLIYSPDSRILECHLNLTAVDIFQFKFKDEIFIKDKYYQILEIKNYQVGGQASTKVTLLTLNDEFVGTCLDCDFALASITEFGSTTPTNTWNNRYLWCPSNDANCITGSTPPSTELDLAGGTSYIGTMTSKPCCQCVGGLFVYVNPNEQISGYYPFSQWAPQTGYCMPVASSLTPQLADIYRVKNMMKASGGKRYVQMIVGGYARGLSTGTNRDKFSTNILPEFGDDIKIQYTGRQGSTGPITGESHKLILLGKTTGTTKSYAYINGSGLSEPLYIPFNSIVNIRVRGISTVIGGESTTHPLGSTEAFAYYTAFKNESPSTHTVTQLGTANGTSEYALQESGVASTCTLEIDSYTDYIRFGIKDADADAVRMWQLTVDYDVNSIPNMELSIDANYALYQDSNYIHFQNNDRLIWN